VCVVTVATAASEVNAKSAQSNIHGYAAVNLQPAKEGCALGKDGLQLLLAALERPYKYGAGFKCGSFDTDVKATLQLPAIVAAGGDAHHV
jgi:hypothetical protein